MIASQNFALPWGIDFIDRYKERWNWNKLSVNIALPWSIDFIDRYKDRWNWMALRENKALPHQLYELFVADKKL